MFTKSGGGVSALFDASSDLLRDTVRLPAFRLAAGDVNDELPARRLLKAFQIPTVTAKLAASLNKAGVKNAAAASLGLAPIRTTAGLTSPPSAKRPVCSSRQRKPSASGAV